MEILNKTKPQYKQKLLNVSIYSKTANKRTHRSLLHSSNFFFVDPSQCGQKTFHSGFRDWSEKP